MKLYEIKLQTHKLLVHLCCEWLIKLKLKDKQMNVEEELP